MNRRNVLRALGSSAAAIGAVAIGASPVGAQNQNAGGPTLAISSPECETLVLDRDDRGPTTEVTVSGPTSFTTTLGRGERLTRTVDPGTYTVESGSPAVGIEPSTIEVTKCLPPGVDAWLDCSKGRALHFHNPLDRNVYVRWRRTVVETGQVNSRGRSLLEPGETSDWPVTRPDDGVQTYHYEYWIAEGYYADEPEVPINGSLDPLIITEPCEELDLPRSPP